MQIINTIVAASALLASAATAAPASGPVANVVVINKPLASRPNPPSKKTVIDVPFGKLTHVDNLEVTELQLKSVSGSLAPDVNQVTCQMYKDQYGTQPGSAQFNKKTPALISTNEVQFGWVLCYVNVDSA